MGFTGTSAGMTVPQEATLTRLVERYPAKQYNHGDCVGADEGFHNVVRAVYAHEAFIVSHPAEGMGKGKRAFTFANQIRTPKPPLDRNTVIVQESTVLVATPRQMYQVRRSGTWSTIRRGIKAGIPVYIIWPDGRLENWSKHVA